MPTEIKIPTLGESIASGLLSKWHKKDGETVKAGDILITLETDKVAQDIAADVAGVLHHIAKEGDDVPVGAVVGSISESTGAPVAEAAKPAAPAPEKVVAQVAAVVATPTRSC